MKLINSSEKSRKALKLFFQLQNLHISMTEIKSFFLTMRPHCLSTKTCDI